MQGTRWQLLTVLKRKHCATVDELAQALGLASVSIRQHLLILQRDGYVTAQEVRGAAGRPHHCYSITLAGDDLFPKGYRNLLESLLKEVEALEAEELEGLEGNEKVRLILRKMADRQVAQRQWALAGKSLEERVAVVSGFFGEEGDFSEWTKTEDGFKIIRYNCPYRRAAESIEQFCLYHDRLVREMLQATVVKDLSIANGDGKCSFVIWPNGSS